MTEASQYPATMGEAFAFTKDMTDEELRKQLNVHYAWDTGKPDNETEEERGVRWGHLIQVGMLLIELKSRMTRRKWRAWLSMNGADEWRRKRLNDLMGIAREMGKGKLELVGIEYEH